MVLSIVISAAIALVIFAIANKKVKEVVEVPEPQKEEITVSSPELEYFPDVNFIEEKEEVAVVEEEKVEPKKKKAPTKKKATTKAKPKK